MDSEVYEFEANESIFSPDDFDFKVGFIVQGECTVEKLKADGSSIPLNKLTRGDSFGILTLFSKSKEFPTLVRASKKASVMFLSKETVLELIKKHPQVSLSIISFMSDRIEFLNRKIATFSADSVEEKFAVYLLNEAKALNSASLTLNLSKTAKILNAGRASIYRAIDALEKLALIKLENKKIYITDLTRLERITK